jgi:hypothetical protein
MNLDIYEPQIYFSKKCNRNKFKKGFRESSHVTVRESYFEIYKYVLISTVAADQGRIGMKC